MCCLQEYYEILSKHYKNEQEVITEIINLQAILNLPKGTEHFLSDLHGEASIFKYLMRSASGVIFTKIDLAFGKTLTHEEKQELAELICHPHRCLSALSRDGNNVQEKQKLLLSRLIEVIKIVSAKYTRSKVRKALPIDYRYIIDELINIPITENEIKTEYYNNIIESIIELNNGEKFIIAMCDIISELAVDHLHIIGDIFDRGPSAAEILDMLKKYHSLDIQWGNHDVLWMGAHFGNKACVCNILRINLAYRNTQAIEADYGINLRPLSVFATDEYTNEDIKNFTISNIFGSESDFEKDDLLAKMTKAITVIQLKLENQWVMRHPELGMNDRILYPSFELTPKESTLIDILTQEFMNSKRLKEHIRFLLSKGSMYKVANGNLLFHGCIPTEQDGSFSFVKIQGETFSGKALYERIEKIVRDAAKGDGYSIDFLWYLWAGKKSPLYGRDKMCVYEKFFQAQSSQEKKDPYYAFIKEEDYCLKVLDEFGLKGEYSTIINGHIPVKVKDGEQPESGNCRHITIDGGFSRVYRKKTGISGFTLINNSQGLFLVSHLKEQLDQPTNSNQDIVLVSKVKKMKMYDKRILIKETDKGRSIQKQIDILKQMLKEYYRIYIDE